MNISMAPEKKFYDIELSDAVIGAPGIQFAVNSGAGPATDSETIHDIPQGTGESQRIGRKCTITNIYMRLNFEWLESSSSASFNSATNSHEIIRIIMYWDKQCNGAAIAAGALLEENIAMAVTPYSWRNLANKGRFNFLYDKTYSWNTGAVSGIGGDNVLKSERIVKGYTVRISKKVFIPIEFNSTSGDIQEMTTNNIGFVLISKHGGRMALEKSRVRIRFRDY